MQFPSQDSFATHRFTLSEKVQEHLTAQDLDEIFAPRVPDEIAQSFFPGFAALRQENVSAQLFTRFSKIPKPWRENWRSRLYLNTLTAVAAYDESLRNVLTTKGPVPQDECGAEIIGRALDREWCFALWSYAQTASAPQETFFVFDLLVLKSCFVIETVESRVDGKPGGWHLVEEVLHILDTYGTEWQVPWIHTLSTNPESTSIFRHYGFVEAVVEGNLHSERAAPLRRAVRRPTRDVGSPPRDLEHLGPS